MDKLTIILLESIVATTNRYPRFLDKNWISWKRIEGQWIGKRCVSWNGGFRYGWLEEVEGEVHKYLCGDDADYEELFTIQDNEES